MYRKGFWLIFIESDGSELAVACQILSRDDTRLRLRAHIPPSWYPQTFTGFKVREDGVILGWRRLPADALVEVPAHGGLHTVDLECPLIGVSQRPPVGAIQQEFAASGG